MNPDGKLFNILSTIGDLFILNIAWVIACIPIVTIGAAETALYYNTLKIAENRESYVWKSFWRSFRDNFKQATVIWLMALVAMAVLALDLGISGNLSEAAQGVFKIVLLAVFIFFWLELSFVFPVLARFENTTGGILKAAFVMAIQHFPSALLILVIHALPWLPSMVSLELEVLILLPVLLFLRAALALAESFFFARIFKNYYPKNPGEDS